MMKQIVQERVKWSQLASVEATPEGYVRSSVTRNRPNRMRTKT